MRELLVIRHAIAHPRDKRRWPDDDERPLTRAGEKKFRKAAQGIAAITGKPDELLCSPLVRTQQTARVLEKSAGYPRVRTFPELRPEVETGELVAALRRLPAKRIAIVGHEPSLSRLLAALLLNRHSAAAMTMKKGALACLVFDRRTPRLMTFVSPKILRALA